MSIYLLVDYPPNQPKGLFEHLFVWPTQHLKWSIVRWTYGISVSIPEVVELSTIELSTICPYSPKMSDLPDLPYLVHKCPPCPLCPSLSYFVRFTLALVWPNSQSQIGQITTNHPPGISLLRLVLPLYAKFLLWVERTPKDCGIYRLSDWILVLSLSADCYPRNLRVLSCFSCEPFAIARISSG